MLCLRLCCAVCGAVLRRAVMCAATALCRASVRKQAGPPSLTDFRHRSPPPSPAGCAQAHWPHGQRTGEGEAGCRRGGWARWIRHWKCLLVPTSLPFLRTSPLPPCVAPLAALQISEHPAMKAGRNLALQPRPPPTHPHTPTHTTLAIVSPLQTNEHQAMKSVHHKAQIIDELEATMPRCLEEWLEVSSPFIHILRIDPDRCAGQPVPPVDMR